MHASVVRSSGHGYSAHRLPLQGIADERDNSRVPRECWKLSRGLRVVTGVQGLIELGLLYVIVRSFFPHAFLRPVMVVAGALFIALCFARLQVTLDPVDAEVGITIGFWTRHVRLTQVERVEVRRFGTEIRVANGESYQFGPMPKFRLLESLLPIRSGFEGMDLAITQAAADARAADPDRAAAEDAATAGQAESWPCL